MKGGENERQLDHTPTWAVASICAIIIIISICLEKGLHHIEQFFQQKRKKAIVEALYKVKGELMVLGFISLLLTFGQNYIARVCIPEEFADTMLPCAKPEESSTTEHDPVAEHRRRLLWVGKRILAADIEPIGCEEGKEPFISIEALHQLHIFIFFLAVLHVFFSGIVMMLGRLKIRAWKEWENEALLNADISTHASKLRLTHELSFVRDNTSFWNKIPILFVIACFFRQFFRSVRRSDYMAMRHGFISVHLSPGSKFDFRKYIKRSLEDDFKVVVGISPLLWASAVFFLLVNVHSWDVLTCLSICPLIVILAVGTKLQAIIAQMASEIVDKHESVRGMPVIEVSDKYFWFSWPQSFLYLIHFVLFQNAFEITYFIWISYEFGMRSCFHQRFSLTMGKLALGIGVQVLCSYITLPLYALVTQMGSTMKLSIFNEETSRALKKWQMTVKKRTSVSSRGSSTIGSSHRRARSDTSLHPMNEDSQYSVADSSKHSTNRDRV